MPDEQAADPALVAKTAHAETMHKLAQGAQTILNGDKPEGVPHMGWIIATFRQYGGQNHLEYATNIAPHYVQAAFEELVNDMKNRTEPGVRLDTGSPSEGSDQAGTQAI